MSKKRGITDKQQIFCIEYVIDNNATQAAIRAGYSPTSAKLSGHRNITNDNCMAEIARLRADRAKVSKLTVDVVLNDLEEGLIMAKLKMDLNAIARFCELRGKHLAMFTDRHIDGTDVIAPALSPEDQEKVRAAVIKLVPGGRKETA